MIDPDPKPNPTKPKAGGVEGLEAGGARGAGGAGGAREAGGGLGAGGLGPCSSRSTPSPAPTTAQETCKRSGKKFGPVWPLGQEIPVCPAPDFLFGTISY